MKTIAKFAAVAVVFSAASQAGVVDTPSTSTSTGSSLVLLLKDSTGSFYVESLSATVSSLNSFSSLQSTPAGTYSLDTGNTGSLTMPSVFSSYSSSNLSSWLTGRTTSNITWTILGSSTGNGTLQAGQQVFVAGSNANFFENYPVDSDVSTAANGIKNFFVNDLNASTFVNGVSSTNGYKDSTGGAQAVNTFINNAYTNGATLGSALSIFEVSTGGSAADANSSSGTANVYKSASTLTLNANGTFSYAGADLASPVPVPAAAWLLGSGLVGLMGIGRRRKVAA